MSEPVLSAPGPNSWQIAERFIGTLGSPNSRDAYRRDLLGRAPDNARGALAAARRPGTPPFFRVCSEMMIDPLDAERAHITAWLRMLERYALKPETRHRKVTVVRGFYDYARESEQVITVNPVPSRNKYLGLGALPNESTTPGLEPGQVRAMLRAAQGVSSRDVAILAVLYHQGLRASELCALNTDSFTIDQGRRVLVVEGGKGNKRRDVELHRDAATFVDAYRGRMVAPGHSMVPLLGGFRSAKNPLFVTKDGSRMSRHQIRKLVEHYGAEAGVPVTIRPHALRHACATHMIDDGVALRSVQLFLGHAASTTTERYHRRSDKLRNSPANVLRGILDVEDNEPSENQ